MSIGLVEVKGLTASILVLDAMLKASDVAMVDIKKDMGGGLVTIVVEGTVSAVTAAVNVGCETGNRLSYVVASKVFASPHSATVMYLNNSYKSSRPRFSREACGIIEVYGFVCSIVAVDAALKAADVRVVGMERTKGEQGIGLIVALKVAGSVDAVRCAVEAGVRAAKQVGDVISSNINAMPDRLIYPMIKYTNLKSD